MAMSLCPRFTGPSHRSIASCSLDDIEKWHHLLAPRVLRWAPPQLVGSYVNVVHSVTMHVDSSFGTGLQRDVSSDSSRYRRISTTIQRAPSHAVLFPSRPNTPPYQLQQQHRPTAVYARACTLLKLSKPNKAIVDTRLRPRTTGASLSTHHGVKSVLPPGESLWIHAFSRRLFLALHRVKWRNRVRDHDTIAILWV